MPSGHAYAKALRTVKTCVGSEWCRFGTQNSTQMGKDLEHALWRMYAPHKVKLAVSGCPRNCAEAGIDRKSTRLNSSHSQTSYAVFCFSKKKVLTGPF